MIRCEITSSAAPLFGILQDDPTLTGIHLRMRELADQIWRAAPERAR